MNMHGYRVIIVTPVYEDREASGRLFQELAKEFGHDVFVVAVDDGSVSEPLQIESLDKANINGVILRLRRNVGHQRAIAIGLGYVSEYIRPDQRVVVMDSDGEDLPGTISNLLDQLKPDVFDVAVAQRKNRVETLQFKIFYAIYKWFFSLMTGRSISFGNFMALKPRAVKRLVCMQELSIHVAGAVLSSKLRTSVLPIDRGPRYAGKSKMNFVGLTLHGFKALMIFAEDVLVRVGIACVLIATLSVLGSMTAVFLKVLGYSTPGWSSVVLGILILMLLQTGALALMTLMLTGVMRSGTVTTIISYRDFVDQIISTSKNAENEGQFIWKCS